MATPPSPTPSTGTEDYRSQFNRFLASPETQRTGNGVTVGVVSRMSNEMSRNNVPMSQGHYQAATDSIRRGDGICRYLWSENLHVLDSRGSGFVYNSGFQFHSALRSTHTALSDRDTWTSPSGS